ncbi:hypothetical protein [Vreelandella sp. TE19]
MEDFSPFARLVRIVSEASRCSESMPTNRVWAQVIGHDYTDTIEVYENSLDFYNLIKYNENIISILVNDQATKDLYEKEFKTLKSLPPTFLSGNSWNANKRSTVGSVKFALDMGKALYDSSVEKKEIKVDDEYLSSLKDAAEKLLDSIMNSDLPRELRLKLCDDVIKIKKSISRYELHGLDGIEEAVSTLGGRVGLHPDELDKSKCSDFHSKLNKTFLAYMELAKAANSTSALITNITKFVRSLGIDLGE